MNELLLILSIVVIYGSVLLFYRLFGRTGLYCWTVFATLSANIEVLILVDAFGIEQTLGNVLFASTFIVTDILSETVSKKAASKAVLIGAVTSAVFIVISQSWFLYTPSANDFVSESLRVVFSNTPRLMAASLGVYVIVQVFDVFMYHAIWNKTQKLTGNRDKLLWVRNNVATIMSQLINCVLYNFAAFYGVYPLKTILSIIVAGFAISIVTSLIDTPVVYIARKMNKKYGL